MNLVRRRLSLMLLSMAVSLTIWLMVPAISMAADLATDNATDAAVDHAVSQGADSWQSDKVDGAGKPHPTNIGSRPAGIGAVTDRPLPPVQKAGRLTYDEATDSWIRTAPPIPGTEDGDLDLTRQEMARGEFQKALRSAKAWIKKYGKEAPRYPEALYLKASAELATSDYRAAHDSFQILINDYGHSGFAADALMNDFQIAEQYLAGKRRKAWGGLLRIRDREGGVKILDDITANYPDTELGELAQRTKADYYYARGEFELAEQEYAIFAKNYPNSRFRALALLRSANAALASFPGVKFDDRGLIEAKERYSQFAQAYPDQAKEFDIPAVQGQITSRRAEKVLEIGKFYEKSRKFAAARYYYRQTLVRYPDTTSAAEARGRIERLEKKKALPAETGQPTETGRQIEAVTAIQETAGNSAEQSASTKQSTPAKQGTSGEQSSQ